MKLGIDTQVLNDVHILQTTCITNKNITKIII